MLGLGSGLQGAFPTDPITTASVAAKLVDVNEQTWVLLAPNLQQQWYSVALITLEFLDKPGES